MLQKIAGFLKVFSLCFFTFVWVYVGVFYGLSLIEVSQSTAEAAQQLQTEDLKEIEEEIPIYLSTNGVHTDFVLPVANEIVDWRSVLALANTQVNWVAFGWGDRGFYLDTPTWSDLKLTTALGALSGTGKTAMHVTTYTYFVKDSSAVELKLTKAEYSALTAYIDASFQKKVGLYQQIETEGYSSSDAFYEAKGSYSLFYTCNTWVNQGLKRINQKAALWTLHDQGIFRHYK